MTIWCWLDTRHLCYTTNGEDTEVVSVRKFNLKNDPRKTWSLVALMLSCSKVWKLKAALTNRQHGKRTMLFCPFLSSVFPPEPNKPSSTHRTLPKKRRKVRSFKDQLVPASLLGKRRANKTNYCLHAVPLFAQCSCLTTVRLQRCLRVDFFANCSIRTETGDFYARTRFSSEIMFCRICYSQHPDRAWKTLCTLFSLTQSTSAMFQLSRKDENTYICAEERQGFSWVQILLEVRL